MSRKSVKLTPTWDQLAEIGAEVDLWRPIAEWMDEQELDRIGVSIIASKRPSGQGEALIHWRLIVACDILGLALVDGVKQLKDSLALRAFCGIWFEPPPAPMKVLVAEETFRVQLSEALDECFERWVVTPRRQVGSSRLWMRLLDEWAERRADNKAERQRVARETALYKARLHEAEERRKREFREKERQGI